MSHNLLFIGFLSVSPLIVFLCLLITCSRAVISNVDLRQTRQPSTLPDQQPVIPQRRSRTQATLRSEFELSKYQNPIIKCPEKQENWLNKREDIFVNKTTKCQNKYTRYHSLNLVTSFTARFYIITEITGFCIYWKDSAPPKIVLDETTKLLAEAPDQVV